MLIIESKASHDTANRMSQQLHGPLVSNTQVATDWSYRSRLAMR